MMRLPERYKTDQVSVIVICHTKDDEGMARARRLFTTVNRYAKKTSSATHTAMSEDDGVAIITRRLIRTHSFFKARVKVLVFRKNGKSRLASGNAMSPSDSAYLMAIETFRKCNQKLLPTEFQTEFKRAQQMPSFEALEAAFNATLARWNKVIEGVEAWSALIPADARAGDLRTSEGGHVLARPVGITAFITAFASAADMLSVEHIRAVVHQFADLNSVPWKGLLWNSATKKMNVTVEAEKLASRLWRYVLGLDEDKTTLERDWTAVIDPGNERGNLHLPSPPASAEPSTNP
jgi:DNA sulfur modification protein DndB